MSSARNRNGSGDDFAGYVAGRRFYGRNADSKISYDPNKDNRSIHDSIFEESSYDPWGKPGGGAPLIDKETGRVRTKIEGRMQWHINGITLTAKARKLALQQRSPQYNLIEYRKTTRPLLNKPVLYRRNELNNDSNTQFNATTPTPDQPQVPIEREKSNFEDKSLNNWSRYNQKTNKPVQPVVKANGYSQINIRFDENSVGRSLKNINVFERVKSGVFENKYRIDNNNTEKNFDSDVTSSFKTKREQTAKSPGYSDWFSRNDAGGGAPTYDGGYHARRKNLIDTLENRHIFGNQFINNQTSSGYF